MRWVILTDDHPPQVGGVATWTRAVAAALVAAGDDVTVFARHRHGLEGPPGVRVHGVRGPSFGRYGGWWMRRAARRALDGADAVLATTWPVATRLGDLGDRLHVAYHGSDLTQPPRDGAGFERVASLAACRWVVSRFLERALAARGHVGAWLPAPVDPGPAPPRPACTTWGFVGRAVHAKGGDRFVRLVATAGVRGVLIGDGPAREDWRRLARDVGADIAFAGALPHPEAMRRLDRCDLLLHLPRAHADGSGAEGLGLVALEAASRAIPAVASPTGGAPEAVGPGLVLDDPDDCEDAVEAIRRWWRPDRGTEAHTWLRQTHGSARTAHALRAGW